MTPDRWDRLQRLFYAASGMEPSGRKAYLEAECSADPSLRLQVESLILSSTETAVTGVMESLQFLAASAISVNIGERLGNYEVIRELGRGGMGSVFLAVRADDQFRKQVAIKLMNVAIAGPEMLARFRAERQILADLDHPNIARMLDGGATPSGMPYVVMEYIDGLPIDIYCQVHGLEIPERLALFRQLCDAVMYAHRNLIVHRDLKPANVMVGADGVAKLLDFGIAKLVRDDGAPRTIALTQVSERLMTPEYASPEQVRGEPISTSTDIYSLGVIFYEILTGHRPYKLQTRRPHEVARAILETEPAKPSTVIGRVEEVTRDDGTKITLTPVWVSSARDGSPEKLRRRLRGDLDNIVLMAMRKDPARRYPSMGHLLTDLQRHLEGQPVSARQDTVGYRAAKFFERHRAAVITASLAILALIASTIGTAWQAQVARSERARAERRFNDIRRVANSLLFDVHDAIKDLPGATPARQVIVSKALEFLDGLAKDSSGDLALQRELATAYERVGDVQGKARESSLGDSRSALASYRKALALREAVATAEPNDLAIRRELGPNYGRLSDLLFSNGDSAGALEYCRKAVRVSEQAAAAPGAIRSDRVRLAAGYLDYGFKLAFAGNDRVKGLELCRRSLVMLAELTRQDHSDRRLARLESLANSRTAELLEQDDAKRTEALQLRRKALDVVNGLLAAEPSNVDYRRLGAYATFELADALAGLGNVWEALPYYPRALATFDDLAGADPKNAQYPHDRAVVRVHYAAALGKAGEPGKAAGQYRAAVAEMTELARLRPLNVPGQEVLRAAQRGLAGASLLKSP